MLMQIILFFLAPWALVDGQATRGHDKPKCADYLLSAYECLERIKSSDDVKNLEKRRTSIFEKCAPDLPQDCLSQRRSEDKCEHELLREKIRSLQNETKLNVTGCFKRYPINTRRVNSDPNSMIPPWTQIMALQQPSSMMGADESASPFCAPNPEQMQCIQREMRLLAESTVEVGKRLLNKQRDCLSGSQFSNGGPCRFESNPQLRECIQSAQQTYMRKSAAALDECIQSINKPGATTAPEEEEEESEEK